MAFIDYYKILGVPRTIPQDKVRDAYLKRVKQFHPDLHPNDPKAKAKFQALNEANDVIGDPEKRKLYDQYGERWREGAEQGPQGTAWGNGAEGTQWGSGAQGQGFAEGFDFSAFDNAQGGFSSFFQDLFGRRQGAGPRQARRSSARQNTGEMHASLNIDLYTALLGGEVVLQLKGGQRIKLRVKPETQNGTKVRLRGKGYDRGDGTMGDMIITYNVTLPTNLNDKQKQLLRQMQQGG